MNNVYLYLCVVVMACGFLFARDARENMRIETKKTYVRSENHWVKYQSDVQDQDDLLRKRSHKRRRKITKPVKGLR